MHNRTRRRGLGEVAVVACLLLNGDGQAAPAGQGLDEKTAARLVIDTGMQASVALRPGDRYSFHVATRECCVYMKPVQADVTWSVDPPSAGITIDAKTGDLQVAKSVPHGTTATVRANLEHGRRMLTATVFVFVPAQNPLAGTWRETAQLDCRDSQRVKPEEPIQELAFAADGRYSVTWHPFEIYKDYWGKYRYDLAAGTLSLQIEHGNYVPKDARLAGSFALEDGGKSLVLRKIWFGSKKGTAAAACGHVFAH